MRLAALAAAVALFCGCAGIQPRQELDQGGGGGFSAVEYMAQTSQGTFVGVLRVGEPGRLYSLTLTAPTGTNAIKLLDGAQIDFGSGSLDECRSDGVKVQCDSLEFLNQLSMSGGWTLTQDGIGGLTGMTYNTIRADSATTVAHQFKTSTDYASGKLVSFYDLAVEKAYVLHDGYLASQTPHTLTSLEIDAAAAVATYGGHMLPARAFTVQGATLYVSGASGAGAGNTVFTVSDATNTCTCTFACAGGAGVGSNAVGTLRASCANGAGTGCVYAANARLTFAVSTAGCTTTQPTIQNADFDGVWQ